MGTGTRLSKVAKDLNVGIQTIFEFLQKKGIKVDSNPNFKIPDNIVDILYKEYRSDSEIKKESDKLIRTSKIKKETISIEDQDHELVEEDEEEPVAPAQPEVPVKKPEVVKAPASPEPVSERPGHTVKILGKIDLSPKKPKTPEIPVEAEPVIIPEPVPVPEEPVASLTLPQEETTPIPEPIVIIPETPIEIEHPAPEPVVVTPESDSPPENELKVIGKIDLSELNQRTRPAKKSRSEKEAERQEKIKTEQTKKEEWKKKVQDENPPTEERPASAEGFRPRPAGQESDKTSSGDTGNQGNFYKTRFEKLSGPTVVGKIVLPLDDKKKGKKPDVPGRPNDPNAKKKRKRIQKERVDIDPKKPQTTDPKNNTAKKKIIAKKKIVKVEVTEEDVQKQIKDTLARLTTKGKTKTSKHRRQKREDVRTRQQEEHNREELEKTILKVSEFVSVSELASMMNIQPTQVIATCMSLGLFVSINQRLDAETMSLVAEEFGYEVEFVSVADEEIFQDVDNEEDMVPRPPIVTVMGHVDHGKTSLLDYIRKSNVIAGEAGGITQHIGAYSVILPDGRVITFLDTPGHEAFTAMRARGAKITDIAIIVVAADDNVMPQTIEAINHASAAGVPIVFAINKIDKPGANPDKIKEALASMNYLIEEWGGKYQSQDISAKHGINMEDLLEKVLLEAELLDLKAVPGKRASGTIIESSLDKGRGYVATILVQTGTLHVGDMLLAGPNFGHIKAMFNERGKKITEAGPSTPVLILGLNGAPQAGDKFNVMNSEREAREIAVKREQLIREHGLRTKKHITLEEIGRRIAIGNFQELNIIVKGDVDGSVEALSDSLIKLSTPEIQVNVKHKAVGQISESDVLLAAASDAIIVGFQVRPSMSARKLAEKEEIDIRLYSIIYDAINEMKDAMEGMLSPDIKEEIVATLEIREVFKITKVGTVAGCMVREGKITRNTRIRLIRDGIVVYTGELGSLKRFKEDVKEVANGYECGLNITNFNDMKIGDIIEGYKEVEVKKTL
ncbi:MAG: translation initiation factor IF-2 [Bacteroidales bacterium]|nr:translation initiation factor IF-2 [Bacteroidales bacterium]